jgi:hypothetical protein
MSIKEWYRLWASFVKDAAPLEKPMQPPTDQIYYFTLNYKAQPKVETVNLTINLKHKKTLENE